MNTARRLVRSANLRLRNVANRSLAYDPVTRRRFAYPEGWVRLGQGCGWLVPSSWQVPNPVCYCIGAGEDISFDLALHDLGAQVVIVDPTPRAIAHAAPLLADRADIQFKAYALWDQDCEVTLYEPRNKNHVSHSIVNLQGTNKGFTAPGRTLTSMMNECGHDSIDLLKIDIEGAEYAVLSALLAQQIPVGIIDVEFDELSIPRRGSWDRIRHAVQGLEEAGYALCAVDSGSNYTFVHREYVERAGLS